MSDAKLITSPLGAMTYLETQGYHPGTSGLLVLDTSGHILLAKVLSETALPDCRKFFREALVAGPSASGVVAFTIAAEVGQRVEDVREFALHLHEAGSVLGLPLLDFLVITACPFKGASASFRAREPWS
ncbi:MAG: hypothetical protein WAS25_06250 [Geothrix sp.]|uniref:hypothetical protein n=1 Tax=Geothrix sp. TaxID=1962974 RepID=UPI003BAE34C6